MTSKYPHILIVFGTRPEFIKMVPIIQELRSRSISHSVCSTAQHRGMLDTMFEAFGIVPDYDLKVMTHNQTLTQITTSILQKFEPLLVDLEPDIVLVQGDTTTTFIASLASFYKQIKIGHLEAGLRTREKYNPFPEEMNRRLTSVIADYHFAPTTSAQENLLREGIDERRTFVSGNTVIDALFYSLEIIKSGRAEINDEVENLVGKRKTSHIVLITAHRRENFGRPLINICLALKELALTYYGYVFVFPVHLNPNVREPVNELLAGIKNIYLIEPQDYFSFVYLMYYSHIILTDSGGVQEEGPSLGKPILVLRDTTERPEGVSAGVVRLVGTNKERIISETARLLDSEGEYRKMAISKNPYGDGKSAQRIVDILLS